MNPSIKRRDFLGAFAGAALTARHAHAQNPYRQLPEMTGHGELVVERVVSGKTTRGEVAE